VSGTLVDVLRERAAEDRGHGYRFVTDDGAAPTELSFTELDRRARDVAAELSVIAPQGSRAVLVYPPGLDFVTAFFGALYAGVAPVPVYPPTGPDLAAALARLDHVIADARPEALLGTAAVVAAAEAAGLRIGPGDTPWLATDEVPGGENWTPPRIAAEDIALVQYTSGSTAAPKGVVVRHGQLLANLAAIRQAMGLDADSVAVGWVPSYHDMGLVGFIMEAVYAGFSSYLMSPQDFLRRPALWLESISRFGAVVSGGPNFGFDLCARRVSEAEHAGLDLSSWRVAFSGAEKIRPDVLRRFAGRFAERGFDASAFYPCYGLAEASLFVAGSPRGTGVRSVLASRDLLADNKVVLVGADAPDSVEVASCGRVAAGHGVVIVDPDTATPVESEDTVGEVWFTGDSVASGYWARPDVSAEVFGGRLADGTGPFLRTGDLGFVRDGELFLTGRLKDLLVVAGRNIYPTDVEETAQALDRRLRPGCGAAFQIEGDSTDLVLVQETAEQDQEQLRALAVAVKRAVLARLNVSVADVVLIRARTIPKTSSGKLRRHACRQDYLTGRLDRAGSTE
jgi:phthiocerol/phenolphthiocerol synthesis type-I polyketide synthase C